MLFEDAASGGMNPVMKSLVARSACPTGVAKTWLHFGIA